MLTKASGGTGKAPEAQVVFVVRGEVMVTEFQPLPHSYRMWKVCGFTNTHILRSHSEAAFWKLLQRGIIHTYLVVHTILKIIHAFSRLLNLCKTLHTL